MSASEGTTDPTVAIFICAFPRSAMCRYINLLVSEQPVKYKQPRKLSESTTSINKHIMSNKLTKVLTAGAPKPRSSISQAIVCNGMVYCSGATGVDPKTGKMVDGTVVDRMVFPILRMV